MAARASGVLDTRPRADRLADELEGAAVAAMIAGDLPRAAILAGEHAALVEGSPNPNAKWLTQSLSRDKMLHDYRQLQYLGRRSGTGGIDGAEAVYARALAAIETLPPGTRLPWDSATGRTVLAARSGAVPVAPPGRRAAALADGWDAGRVERDYLTGRIPLVVIDDVLTADTLAALRDFCLGERIWHGNRYRDGRLSALFLHGFNCPLLIQIAEELRARLPAILTPDRPLRQLWAFKNTRPLAADSTIHADCAAVNVNIWLTPEQANLDPETGGMVVYDLAAPPDWDFAAYNRDSDRITDHIARHRPAARVIPYRANRAIIFDSNLFHATSKVAFNDRYEDHRINVTLLFGDRATAPASMPDQPRAWRSAALRRGR